MKRSICILGCFLILAVQVPVAPGQTEFKKALQEKYDYKTVSCFTCHSRKSDIPDEQQAAFKENAKAFRNSFGKELEKLLKGKDITKRLDDVKSLELDDPEKQRVKDEVTKEFLEALKKLEKMESPSGPTYGELLKDAALDGVKPKQ